MSGEEWPCGHPRTNENTQSIGVAGVRCKECRRKISRESFRRRHDTPPERQLVWPFTSPVSA